VKHGTPTLRSLRRRVGFRSWWDRLPACRQQFRAFEDSDSASTTATCTQHRIANQILFSVYLRVLRGESRQKPAGARLYREKSVCKNRRGVRPENRVRPRVGCLSARVLRGPGVRHPVWAQQRRLGVIATPGFRNPLRPTGWESQRLALNARTTKSQCVRRVRIARLTWPESRTGRLLYPRTLRQPGRRHNGIRRISRVFTPIPGFCPVLSWRGGSPELPRDRSETCPTHERSGSPELPRDRSETFPTNERGGSLELPSAC